MDLNMIVETGYGHLCLRENNLRFRYNSDIHFTVICINIKWKSQTRCTSLVIKLKLKNIDTNYVLMTIRDPGGSMS